MSDTEETRARALAHRVLRWPSVCGAAGRRHLFDADDLRQCDSVTAVILEHERVLADKENDRLGWRQMWMAMAEAAAQREAERDALASQLSEARVALETARKVAAEADRAFVEARRETGKIGRELSEAGARVERLEGALRLIKRDWGHRVKAIGACDPYEVARAALEGTGTVPEGTAVLPGETP